MKNRLAELRALPVPEGLPRLDTAKDTYIDDDPALWRKVDGSWDAYLWWNDPRCMASAITGEFLLDGDIRIGNFPTREEAIEALRSLGYRGVGDV